VFAPDPIRQRNYVDLRQPPEEPPAGAPAARPPWSADAPIPARLGSRKTRRRWPRVTDLFMDRGSDAVGGARSPERVHSGLRRVGDAYRRGGSLSTVSAAVLMSIGAGLAGLAVVHLFETPDVLPKVATAPAVQTTTPVATAAAEPAPRTVPVLSAESFARATTRLLGEGPPIATVGPPSLRTTAPAIEAPRVVASTEIRQAAPPDQPPAATAKSPIRPAPKPAANRSPTRPPAASHARDDEVLAYAPLAPPDDPVGRSLLGRSAPEDKDSPPPHTGAGTAKVTTDVRMRARPDNNASVVTVLAAGRTVRIVACDYWCEVVADGKRGFVFRKFVGR
jgi:hypothetical protein